MPRKKKLPEGNSLKIEYSYKFERGMGNDGKTAILLKTILRIENEEHESTIPLPLGDWPEMVEASHWMGHMFEKWLRLSVFFSLMGIDEEIFYGVMARMFSQDSRLRRAKGFAKEFRRFGLEVAQQVASFEKTRRENLGLIGIKGGSERRAELSLLHWHYEFIHQTLTDAASLYESLQRSSPKRSEWRKAIKEHFPSLDEDLIERLQPVPLWPLDLTERVKDPNNEPDDIALEYAARRCGAEPDSYAPSTLREYLKRQRREKFQTIH